MGTIRVLQLVADTDPDPSTDAALVLHQRLVGQGLEVRTLALAPGNLAGHEALLPVIAHSRRSIAARTGVQAERKWADVVVLHGPRALVGATVPPRSSRPPTVYAAAVAAGLDDLDIGGRNVGRFAERLAAVVVPQGQGAGGAPSEAVAIAADEAGGAEWAGLLGRLVAADAARGA